MKVGDRVFRKSSGEHAILTAIFDGYVSISVSETNSAEGYADTCNLDDIEPFNLVKITKREINCGNCKHCNPLTWDAEMGCCMCPVPSSMQEKRKRTVSLKKDGMNCGCFSTIVQQE